MMHTIITVVKFTHGHTDGGVTYSVTLTTVRCSYYRRSVRHSILLRSMDTVTW